MSKWGRFWQGFMQGLSRRPYQIDSGRIVRANDKLQYYVDNRNQYLPSDLLHLIYKLDQAIKEETEI